MSRRRDTTYTPATYVGDGLEVVANLSSGTVPTAVLVAVAKWHERRKDSRNRIIASRLRELVAANDNRRRG